LEVIRTCWRVEVVHEFAGAADGDWRAKEPGRLAGVIVQEDSARIKSDAIGRKKGIGVLASTELES
jgi:hypothetical protein